jgi:hypothetical protein
MALIKVFVKTKRGEIAISVPIETKSQGDTRRKLSDRKKVRRTFSVSLADFLKAAESEVPGISDCHTLWITSGSGSIREVNRIMGSYA